MADDPDPIYVDGMQVTCGPFTVSLGFTCSPAQFDGRSPAPLVADLRMSPEHAKVMAMIMRRQLKEYERELGQPIRIHPGMLQQLGFSPEEDW